MEICLCTTPYGVYGGVPVWGDSSIVGCWSYFLLDLVHVLPSQAQAQQQSPAEQDSKDSFKIRLCRKDSNSGSDVSTGSPHDRAARCAGRNSHVAFSTNSTGGVGGMSRFCLTWLTFPFFYKEWRNRTETMHPRAGIPRRRNDAPYDIGATKNYGDTRGVISGEIVPHCST